MCGIWASLGLNPPRAVITAVAHRGPDGEGWRDIDTSAGQLCLAHRRLAVIDTSSGGAQPMAYADGRYWLTYNGEIYNYLELRAELQCLGHVFASASDSEVLLAAYAQWGVDCLRRFNGMFAFVLWDTEAQRLFAARDRYGIKPLYVWRDGGGVAFASEIKQYLQLPEFPVRLDEARAYDFLAFGLLNHKVGTLFDGVRAVMPGTAICVELSTWGKEAELQIIRWYDLPVPEPTTESSADLAVRVIDLLRSSVQLRMRSDVRVGSCLSGGIDSSSIVCLAAETAAEPMITVGACFEVSSADERPFMEMVNASIASQPAYVYPQYMDLADILDKAVYSQDMPITTTSVLAQWAVFRQARESGAVVMLDGQGADEQACGYHAAFPVFHRDLIARGQFCHATREILARRRRHSVGLFSQAVEIANRLVPDFVRHFAYWVRGIHRPAWLQQAFSRRHGISLPKLRNLEELIAHNMRVSGLPMLLHYEDRNSMAHGIEARLPFLDYRLVDHMVGLGAQYKIVDGETKWLLRRAVETVIPRKIVERQEKVAFSTPQDEWIRGQLRPAVEQGITTALERFPSLFDGPMIRAIVPRHLDGHRPLPEWLWRVATFGIWARIFDVADR